MFGNSSGAQHGRVHDTSARLRCVDGIFEAGGGMRLPVHFQIEFDPTRHILRTTFLPEASSHVGRQKVLHMKSHEKASSHMHLSVATSLLHMVTLAEVSRHACC